MKGVSTILATILIVIIVVALVSITYTFAVGLVSTSTRGASTGTEELTKKLQQNVEFVTASCASGSPGTIKFAVRHSGSINITVGNLNALVDGSIISTNPDITTASLGIGEVKNFTIDSVNTRAGQDITVTVSAPASPVDKIVTCS